MDGKAPVVDIDVTAFETDPYPALKSMRRDTPICYVPQLGAMLLTRHEDIVVCEKNVEVFSSVQPGGLMTVLMGENMMRKDGAQHVLERRQAMPALSPKVVKQVWRSYFEQATDDVIETLSSKSQCDLVNEFAMPVAAHALRYITGLTNMTPSQLDACSQGMIDGIANYSADPKAEQRCNDSTALIDRSIDQMTHPGSDLMGDSLLQVLLNADQPMDSIRANIKLAISGGQNEPRDAIAGCVWALLTHRDQLRSVLAGDVAWRQVFSEYARWISPIGMSPRRVARSFEYNDVTFAENSRAFLMFSSANRDESNFMEPDNFDLQRDTSDAISFGAGPHFCAGAAASRVLIADVALPKLFEAFPDMKLNAEVQFSGWAFRGPVSVPVELQ